MGVGEKTILKEQDPNNVIDHIRLQFKPGLMFVTKEHLVAAFIQSQVYTSFQLAIFYVIAGSFIGGKIKFHH